MTKRLVLCDCQKTQTLDVDILSAASGFECSRVFTGLCTHQLPEAQKLIAEGNVLLACGQETARFSELAADIGADEPDFIDLRDRAGWSDDTNTAPKMAALLVDHLRPAPQVKTRDVESHGMCLIIGPSSHVFEPAAQLAQSLSVTVLLTDQKVDLPLTRDYEVVAGKVRNVAGSFGRFELVIDAFQSLDPSGRGAMRLTAPRDGAHTQCDLILDLSGEAALFLAPHKRDGYLRADPKSLPAVALLVAQAAQMVGTFEKTVFLNFEEHLCAHSRASQKGCNRCLDICPTGAIMSLGEHVEIDPMICAGCGACAALCPSGAITNDAPKASDIVKRIGAMAQAYHKAGGTAARLLVHDDHGAEMISLAARFDKGLPADVIPMHVSALLSVGHAEILAALTSGFVHVDILLAPTSEKETIDFEIALAVAIGASGRVGLLDISDPSDLSKALYGVKTSALDFDPILALGNRRQVTRLAAQALNPNTEVPLALPEGAPYGAVLVNTDSCTLCLSCVSLCPSGALLDNPDMPQLRFQEDACLQCGICASACPEDAITLVPQLDISAVALGQRVLNEEEPFCCVECGAAFGVKSTVEKILKKLDGKHSMFAEGGAGRIIQMCDKCRVNAQFHRENNPLSGGERPRMRTTEDYLSKRRDH